MIEPVVIGFGGNVGGDAVIVERFCRAREALASLGDVRAAPLYRSAPSAYPGSTDLNALIVHFLLFARVRGPLKESHVDMRAVVPEPSRYIVKVAFGGRSTLDFRTDNLCGHSASAPAE